MAKKQVSLRERIWNNNVLAKYDTGELEHLRLQDDVRQELAELGCLVIALTYDPSYWERAVTIRFSPTMSLEQTVRAARLAEHLSINGLCGDEEIHKEPDGSVLLSFVLD